VANFKKWPYNRALAWNQGRFLEIVENKEDFTKAKFTAIISDLHLCEPEPEHADDLWKKFKTKEFFFDEDFRQFLEVIQKKAEGQQVELILNGDIFDFDSVMEIPDEPPYRVSWLEKKSGLFAQEAKSKFKIGLILKSHPVWVEALRKFILNGNRVIFVIGNHDLELHFPSVQNEVLETLNIPKKQQYLVRFCEWFYVSNKDTLIEHGNQLDPYCVCQDPINPFILKFNRVELRLPFGNLSGRYLTNMMGYINPHADANFIMSFSEYVSFFKNYLIKSQPLIIMTWFFGALMTLFQSFFDQLSPSLTDPLAIEDKVEEIARKANATPRMVRELRELAEPQATRYPLIILRELWLDRAFLVLIAFFGAFQIFTYIKLVYNFSFFWMFIPLFLCLPFFIFCSKSVVSNAEKYKEPRERILSLEAHITNLKRVVYGHTHVIRHESMGDIEHLNSGTWSPAFKDVECTKKISRHVFVWLEPQEAYRAAQLFEINGTDIREIPSKSLETGLVQSEAV
jgi:UDP-2,3-diacylglucosamine pyrophosphatase LpxH